MIGNDEPSDRAGGNTKRFDRIGEMIRGKHLKRAGQHRFESKIASFYDFVSSQGSGAAEFEQQ